MRNPFTHRKSKSKAPQKPPSMPPPPLLRIRCTGNPYQIGFTHGSLASIHISRCIAFYRNLFVKKCSLTWESSLAIAIKFQPFLESCFPDYVEEMRGVAEGAGVGYEDILALNCRTEIVFGSLVEGNGKGKGVDRDGNAGKEKNEQSVGMMDGCTAISWNGKRDDHSVLGQNWDWNIEQAQNLINLQIELPSGVEIEQVTEAGIIGKIGFNSNGVGVCLNAIKAHGICYTKLPVHLALRTILESESLNTALEILENVGVASSCHILFADRSSAIGLECHSEDIVEIEEDSWGMIMHTNHFWADHEDVEEDLGWCKDSRWRMTRAGSLMARVEDEEPSVEILERVLGDEMEGMGVGEKAAICRSSLGKGDGLETLFSIVMDLGNGRARVKIGRPCQPTEVLVLAIGMESGE